MILYLETRVILKLALRCLCAIEKQSACHRVLLPCKFASFESVFLVLISSSRSYRYNADFDGDEMNCHLPMSILAKAECAHIVHNSHQYIVPTDGGPVRGLIQVH